MNKIRKVRKVKGYSQTELAQILKINRNTIVQYENGKIKNPNTEIIKRMAKLFQCKMEDLI